MPSIDDNNDVITATGTNKSHARNLRSSLRGSDYTADDSRHPPDRLTA